MLVKVPRDCCLMLLSSGIPGHIHGRIEKFFLRVIWPALSEEFTLFHDKPASFNRNLTFRTTECKHTGIKGSIAYFPQPGAPFVFQTDEGWSELVTASGNNYLKHIVIGGTYHSGIVDYGSYYTTYEVKTENDASKRCYAISHTRMSYYPNRVVRYTTYYYGVIGYNKISRRFSRKSGNYTEMQNYEFTRSQFDHRSILHPLVDLTSSLTKARNLDPSTSYTLTPYADCVNASLEGVEVVLKKWLRIPELKGPTAEILGQLSNDFAVQLYDTQVNLLSYIKEGFELIEVIKGDITKIKSLAHCSINGRIKDLAGLYLSYHYGYRLTVADTSELIADAIDGLVNTDANRVTVHRSYHSDDMDVYFSLSGVPSLRTDEISQTIEGLISNGLFGLNILWDMIPFSFVFDWFTSFISSGAETLDHRALLSTYNVKDVLVCQRVSRTEQVGKFLPLAMGLDFTGEISPFNFVRSRREALPLPLSTNDVGVPIKHWFEGLTLIIANN